MENEVVNAGVACIVHTYYVSGVIPGPGEDAKKVEGHLYLQEFQNAVGEGAYEQRTKIKSKCAVMGIRAKYQGSKEEVGEGVDSDYRV